MESRNINFDPGEDLHHELKNIMNKANKKITKREIIIELIKDGLKAKEDHDLITQLRLENSELKRILLENNTHVVRTNMFLNELSSILLECEKYEDLRAKVQTRLTKYLKERGTDAK